MKNKLVFIIVAFLNLNIIAQFTCNDIFYNADTLVVINDENPDSTSLSEPELFTGYCETLDKHGRLQSKDYINFGILDSVVYFDKQGKITAVESYRKWIKNGVSKTYYKSGMLKQSITFKNDHFFGLWREYYKNGQIKYEADHINDYTTKDNSHYTWTKKGVKYLHTCVDIDKTKNIGKMTVYSARSKCRKRKVE